MVKGQSRWLIYRGEGTRRQTTLMLLDILARERSLGLWIGVLYNIYVICTPTPVN